MVNIHIASFKDSYIGGAVDSGVLDYGTVSFTSNSRRVERS